MSALDTTLIADPAQILGVAQDVFAALIDDGEVLVHEGVVPESFDVPVTAWVDMLRADSPHGVRTMVRAEEADAHLVVRALLRMEPDEVVGEEDLVDAFGYEQDHLRAPISSGIEAERQQEARAYYDALRASGEMPIDEKALKNAK